MPHAEHLGIAFANIVYAFLMGIDYNDFDESIRRLLEGCSREKRTLITFLMKKKMKCSASDTDCDACNTWAGNEVKKSEVPGIRRDGNAKSWGHHIGDPYPMGADSRAEASDIDLLERVISSNDVVTQLTIVRNAFLDCLTKLQEAPARDSSFSSVATSSSATAVTQQALQPIPVLCSGSFLDGGVKAIEEVVGGLSQKLRRSCHPSVLARSVVESDRSINNDFSEQWDPNCIQMQCAGVDLLWMFSLCLVLAPQQSVQIRFRSLFHCSRFFLSGRSAVSSCEGNSTLPRLCDVPPVFYLSHDLVTKLEAHFHKLLLNQGSGVSPMWYMYRLQLGRACYGLLSAVDERAADTTCRTVVQTCASVMRVARLSCRSWENVDWSGLIVEAAPSSSSAAEREALGRDLECIWRRRHRWWVDITDDVTHATDGAWAKTLPIILSGALPCFLFSRFGGTAARISSLYNLSKSSSTTKTEKTPGDNFSALVCYTMHLCNIFNHRTSRNTVLRDLLGLVKKMITHSKKDKRDRELVTLLLSGCFLPQATVCSNHCVDDSKPNDSTPPKEEAEALLHDVDRWRKPKHAILYSLSTVALLGMLSVEAFAQRLVTFFATMESWLLAAESNERIAILYSILHACGLLRDVSTSSPQALAHDWSRCTDGFCHFVEKAVVRGIGCESWRDTRQKSSCVAAASDLLLFSLQQESLHLKACNWLLRLLDTKSKVKSLSKSGKGVPLSRGHLIAMRTISALSEVQCFPNIRISAPTLGDAAGTIVVCSLPGESGTGMWTSQTASIVPKMSIRERIVGLLSSHGSCYNPTVTTIEGSAVMWNGNTFKKAYHFVESSKEIRLGIDEVRKTAFECLRLINLEAQTEDTVELSNHLVYVFLAACFWVPAQEVLDSSLTLPMLLVGAKTPLYDAVHQVVMPFYLLGRGNENMSTCALALHRLAECIIVMLGKDDDERVQHLAEYLTAHLLVLRDKMECLVNNELQAEGKEEINYPLGTNLKAMSVGDKETHKKKVSFRRARWDWLLNAMSTDSFSEKEMPCSLSVKEEWCAIPALRGTAVIDTLEGLAVVLLGHSRRQVRRTALLQLELLASLLRLQRRHCRFSSETSSFVDVSGSPQQSPHVKAASLGAASSFAVYTEGLYFPRFAVAEIFTDLGGQFEEMYISQKEPYLPLVRLFDGRVFTPFYSPDDCSVVSGECRWLRDSCIVGFEDMHDASGVCSAKSAHQPPSLFATPFGARCLAGDADVPHFVFVATVALTLVMYGYRPGSAIVRVVCAIAGELVVRGEKHCRERSFSMWRSCYALNFLLLCVDNAKNSPEANRLTRGSERNRPGHQQGGNSTFVGGRDSTSGVEWQIVNRYAEYNKLMNNITVNLLLEEINTEAVSPHFLDLLQYLLVGPLEFVSAGNSTLVTFAGMMDSDHPIVTKLQNLLAQCHSKMRRTKQHIAHASLAILLPILVIIGRRYFVKPPIAPGRIQDTVATKRTRMEGIFQGIIDSVLLGDPICMEHPDEHEAERLLSFETLGRTLSEGHGVAARSWLALPFLPSVVAKSETGCHTLQGTLSEMTPIIVLRGVFCDLIGMVYSKDAKYLEAQLKRKLLSKVLYSLTYQVHWFLRGNTNCTGSGFEARWPKCMVTVLAKAILALQTVVSSVELLACSRQHLEHTNIIGVFSKKFFQWLQRELSTDCNDLEKSSPSVFGLAVTLLVADSASRESVRRVLRELPIGSPVHRTFFAVIVTAMSVKWAGQREPLLALRQSSRAETSQVRSEVSSDTFAASVLSTTKADNVVVEISKSGTLIFYALAYLYEDATVGYVFDAAVRSKALGLLFRLCGESPSESGACAVDDWLFLLLKAYRSGIGEAECANGFLQSLFAMATGDVLSAERKANSPAQLQRIALKLLTLLLKRIEATDSNLRTVLQVTQACRNSSSEHDLAELWGGWIAYEGRERERFVSLLVSSSIDLADKRIVTYYIDSYINHESMLQGTRRNCRLSGRLRGAYYSFLIFSLYQMKLLRYNMARGTANNNNDTSNHNNMKAERMSDPFFDSMRDEGPRHSSTLCLSRSFSHPESQVNKGINQNGAAKRKMLWVMEENIWRVPVRLTRENLKENSDIHQTREKQVERCGSSFSSEARDDQATLREVGFVKPLVSVLFFASWAMDRLRQRGWNLWSELHKDLDTITGYMVKESSSEVKLAPPELDFASDTSVSETMESDEGSEEEHSASQQEQTESDCPSCSSPCQRASTTNKTAAAADAELHSEAGSGDTVIVHAHIPKLSFREAIASHTKQAEKQNKRGKSKHLTNTNVPFSKLHRAFLVLFHHSACMLLVHMGCGEMRCGEQRGELLSRFHVIESTFEALGSLLKGNASEGSYRAPSSLRHWLKLTFTRLDHHEKVKPRGGDVGGGSGGSGYCDGSCTAALVMEPSLVLGNPELDGRVNDSASSSADVVLTELFLSIAGHGRNMKGRHYMLRWLHESFTWMQQSSAGKGVAKTRLHVLYSHISLLSLKVARSISACLSFTTGVLVVGCDWRLMWMEKTAMQLAEANALRQLLTTLLDQTKALHWDVSPNTGLPFMGAHHYVFCSSILTSLGCLLRDIIIHETYYCTSIHIREMGEKKPEALGLAIPFSDNSVFPARHLLSCFWAGFALLLTPNTWQAACNMLAVFHRYGCARFLGSITVPVLSPPKLLCFDVAPDCAAVQLVLLQQGRSAQVRQKVDSMLQCDCGWRMHDTAADAVLNYLHEYANEKDEGALLLAFTEFVILCDWGSLDLELHAPKFAAFTRNEDVQGRPNTTPTVQRDGISPNAFPCHSFSQCLLALAESWKRCVLELPDECQGMSRSLSSRISFLLEELLKMSVKAFSVPSVDVLLHRVAATKSGHGGSLEATLSQSKSHNTDLCSLHSCANNSRERHYLFEESVLSFQRLFESLVMVPLMSLFQSSQTPLSLWSKILAFVSALLSYYEPKYGFVVDLLRKFLPDVERGLCVGTLYGSLTDETPFFDRLVVPVLADEVAMKVMNLKAVLLRKPTSVLSYESMKWIPMLTSLLDNATVVHALIDFLAKDSFSIPLMTFDMQTAGGSSLEMSGSSKPIFTREKRMKSGSFNDRTSHESRSDEDADKKFCAVGASHTTAHCSVELNSSNLSMKQTACAISKPKSHYFGNYVYEVLSSAYGAPPIMGQLPLECYRPSMNADLSAGVAPPGTSEEDGGNEHPGSLAKRSKSRHEQNCIYLWDVSSLSASDSTSDTDSLSTLADERSSNNDDDSLASSS
ncbi:hypothetical protein DQ04_01381080 [Trypanosoma grayi]|uniref:hypothetical protein n=1 Tax=Trypanosoma grayi TaxID=71804 RepID=UPI0004F45373|nr:hypothetical protein DQ04_01381080 [Trypanosoma grayi]KEG12852.1 hypothetical protein DQ04_01381080 [Trypanosoma grayi]